MKKVIYILLIIITVSLGITSGSVMAIPTLQLDIAGGTYDTTTETIVASGNPFTLYALLIEDSKNKVGDTYYISAALAPKTKSPDDYGSFTFNGDTIDVTGDMIYGVPPVETYGSAFWDSGDLQRHGIFSTYFKEFEFKFDAANKAIPYNTQDNAGDGPTPSANGTMYYASFTVDTSGLDPEYLIHFDLYNTYLASCRDVDICKSCFAPFSHDAESGKVPEPATLLLLGIGLVGLTLWGRRKNHRA